MSFHFGSEEFDKVLVLGKCLRDMERNFSVAFENAFDDVELFITDDSIDDKFFEMMKELQTCMFTGYSRRKPKKAIDAFVGQCVREDRFFDAMRFARTYSHVSYLFSEGLFDYIEGYGDDSFSDLCDSLPLGGRKVINAVLAGEINNTQELETLVHSVVVGREQDENRRFILIGENYMRMRLREKLQSSFTYAAECWVKNASSRIICDGCGDGFSDEDDFNAHAEGDCAFAAPLEDSDWFDD